MEVWPQAIARLLPSLSIEEALVQSIAAALGVESEQSIEEQALEVGQQHMLPVYFKNPRFAMSTS